MGANFHTAYADGSTIFAASSMEPPLSDLDRAISYTKNVIVHCDGVINYSAASGQLTWSGALRILFVRADGQLIQNTVATGGVTLSDNQMAYVDLSETNDAAVTVSAASLTTAAASTTKAYNRLVLGYRNTASDAFYPVNVRLPVNPSVVGFFGAVPAAKNTVTLVNTDGAIGSLAIGATYSQAEVQALRNAAETLADDVRALKAALSSYGLV
ncbi:hypothetical protein [Anaeromusa acidaminophila]|uniref:hypothetical protein n=1 Tax=Anaeromusa acidaminophila TaxID=81464 RepID=UPI0003636D87|nr:hypothetical protein [Anaeromusa acidaminophila]